ncbi:hypothetical protein QAD02_004360 [Eretmocerus hayati]|uniref:Uncharacterized protein n=1 Tax=Eretmocerus hayati TaxID=131215 RepID=A0ACC2NS25_9HYME|nr:hypothetical protein QAD02_004360 [Eretmocerus hayati]
MKNGCIHKGDFISATRCHEICQDLFKGNYHLEGLARGYCEYNQECHCEYPSFRYGGTIVFTSAADLEEQRLKNSKMAEKMAESVRYSVDEAQAGPSHAHDEGMSIQWNNLNQVQTLQNMLCSYRDEIITKQECQQRCHDFVENAGIEGGTDGLCEEYGSCKCMIESKVKEGFVSYERLDTLEAQSLNEGIRRSEHAQEREGEEKKEEEKPMGFFGRTFRQMQEEFAGLSCISGDPENLSGLDRM